MFQILVKTSNGNTITIDIEPTSTIHHLKEVLNIRTRIPEIFQLIIYNGRILVDNRTIESYSITDSCTLYMNLRMNPIIIQPQISRPIDSILGKRKKIE